MSRAALEAMGAAIDAGDHDRALALATFAERADPTAMGAASHVRNLIPRDEPPGATAQLSEASAGLLRVATGTADTETVEAPGGWAPLTAGCAD